MYIRTLHNQLTNSSTYYKNIVDTPINWAGRQISQHLPAGIISLVDRVAFAFEMVLPRMAIVTGAAALAYFTGNPQAALGALGALIWFSFDVADAIQFYPYDYLENLADDSFQKDARSIIVRPSLINRIVFYLSKPEANNNNVMAIGPAGCGKTSTALALVQLIKSKGCPKELIGKKIFRIRLDKLSANASRPGDFEMRFLALLNAIQFDKDIILFIDEAHQLIDKRGNGGTSLGNMLKPFLSNGMRCLAATTIKEYKKHIVEDEGLEQRFNLVEVPPLTTDTCIKILQKKFPGLSTSTAKTAMYAAKELFPNKALPRSAIILLENTQHRTHSTPTTTSVLRQVKFEKISLGSLAIPKKKFINLRR